jgi:hypothetical protein
MAGGGCSGPFRFWFVVAAVMDACLILVVCFGNLQDHLLLYF